ICGSPAGNAAVSIAANSKSGSRTFPLRWPTSRLPPSKEQPDAPLTLLILVDDALAGRILANRYRPDLAAAGIGDGRHGFRFDFPRSLSPGERHVVRVCREADGTDLAGSPAVLEPAAAGDGAAYEQLAEIDVAALSDADLARGIEIVAEHTDNAIQELGDRQSG